MDKLRKPPWWGPDVEFDPTGEQQMGWARAGTAAYRAAHPERYGASPSVTGSVTGSVTSVTKSVTPGKKSVTSVTSERHSVTESVTDVPGSVTSKKEKTAERTRRWREKRRGSDELGS